MKDQRTSDLFIDWSNFHYVGFQLKLDPLFLLSVMMALDSCDMLLDRESRPVVSWYVGATLTSRQSRHQLKYRQFCSSHSPCRQLTFASAAEPNACSLLRANKMYPNHGNVSLIHGVKWEVFLLSWLFCEVLWAMNGFYIWCWWFMRHN